MDLEQQPPADVLQLWKDVTDGILTYKTVVWTKAVDSIQNAHDYLPASTEARIFIDKYMAQIISIFLKQYSEIANDTEKGCVEKALRCCLQIIKDDLEATCDDDTGESREVCVTLCALTPIFNEKNAELRSKMINFFRSIHGFSELATYLSVRVSSPQFPQMAMVISLLEVMRKSIPIDEEDRGEVEGLQEITDEAIQVSKTIMNHIVGLDEEQLEQIGLNTIRQTRWQLFRLYLRLSRSTPELMSSFFVFWRSLALICIQSQSLPMKLYGWDQIVDIVKDSKSLYVSPPRSYIVSCAGMGFINGRYEFSPQAKVMDNGQLKSSATPIYHRRIHADDLNNSGHERDGKTLTLFKCNMQSLQKMWWFLSEADKQQPGTERDIDYYRHKSKPNEEDLPPPLGWLTMEAGADPPPKLEPVRLNVPSGGDHILEHRLDSWAVENGIIELVFAEPIKSEIVSRSTELIKFLASRIRSREDSTETPDRDHSQMPKDTIMLNQFCLKAWKTCTDTADTELSAQIYQLLVTVVPKLPEELAISLFQTIRDSLVLSDKCENDHVSGFCRNIDVLIDVNQNNMTLVELVRQIKMMVSSGLSSQ